MARERGSNQSPKWLYHLFYIIILLQTFCSLQIDSVAVDSEVIEYLPGFKGPLPFHLETGYVGVGESEEVQLFYYFVKSDRNPKKDPLLLWICGGPGCSGFCGLVYESGPLKFNHKMEHHNINGNLLPTLVPNPYSWTKTSSVIYIDSPVGTGFSYGTTPLAFQTGDLKQVDHLIQFMRKWLINHPEFSDNPFYLSGGSYSGIPIPALALQISKENDDGIAPLINLKGYTLVNPVTDPHLEANSEVTFAKNMALIPHELYKSLKKNCRGEYKNIDPSNTKCLKDMQAYEKCVSRNNFLHISYSSCSSESQNLEDLVAGRFVIEDTAPRCVEDEHVFSVYWANDPSVRKALGIREGTIDIWERCDYDMEYDKDIQNTVEHHFNLSIKGYRSLIFSGDRDMRVTFLATQTWIRSLNFSIVDDWRPWIVQGQIAGYTRTYSNKMTYATVKGGGHTASQYKPRECFFMFQRWIDGQPL